MKKVLSCIIAMVIACTMAFAEKTWHDKGHGYYCNHSICGCTVHLQDDGSCYVIVDGTNEKCTVFKMSGNNTYNAYFKYDDCSYFLVIPW